MDPPYARVEKYEESEEGYETIPDNARERSEPGYETVPTEKRSDPGYETVPTGRTVDPGYETVPTERNRTDPGYETVPSKVRADPGYETVPNEIRDPGYEIVQAKEPGYETVSYDKMAGNSNSLNATVNVVHMSVRKTNSDPQPPILLPRQNGPKPEQKWSKTENNSASSNVVVIEHKTKAVNNNFEVVDEKTSNEIQSHIFV